ncbi:MurR/RpiR family transcriptional regulator [Sneathiella litorea]|uniref:SIS domain-containing protein n=1 Tax=Sneathiella litorea TaxID=2606216 RepID=A0A6L8W906_9PROT|nr:MurR/RpiR family transcriptional regulator [Sneathiella litorea]MZR31618.1 SIS domain-containing protein [Sneathiella litorea]
MTDRQDILKVIENEYDQLSPQLRLAARFALDRPDRIAFHSMREVAAQADVLPPTMLRLAKRLGFNTFNDFRDRFRDRIAAPSGSYAARARQLQAREVFTAGSGLLQEISAADRRNIEQTFDPIEDSAIMAAAETFINAETVNIIGLRKCFPIAFYFHYATRVFFPNARLIQGQAGLYGEEIARISERDAVLVIAFDPYTNETVRAAKAAQSVGAQLTSITDSVVSPLAIGADHLFLAANTSPSFYRSLVGAMAIVQALVAAIVSKLGEEAVIKLQASEALLRDNNTYWINGDAR